MESILKKWLLQPDCREALSQNENDYGLFNQWLNSPERKALQQLKIIKDHEHRSNSFTRQRQSNKPTI